MDRYFVWHSIFDPAPRRWNVVDSRDGGYDRETGSRYIASCPDPEMAQRIADLLNGDDAVGGQFRDSYRLTSGLLPSRMVSV